MKGHGQSRRASPSSSSRRRGGETSAGPLQGAMRAARRFQVHALRRRRLRNWSNGTRPGGFGSCRWTSCPALTGRWSAICLPTATFHDGGVGWTWSHSIIVLQPCFTWRALLALPLPCTSSLSRHGFSREALASALRVFLANLRCRALTNTIIIDSRRNAAAVSNPSIIALAKQPCQPAFGDCA